MINILLAQVILQLTYTLLTYWSLSNVWAPGLEKI